MSEASSGIGTTVLIEKVDDRVAEIILNRPARRNALTGPLAVALRDAVESLEADPEVSVVILRGQGGAFCSGLDLKEFAQDPQPDWVPGFSALWRSVHEAIYDASFILVGALERAAVNGGAALALASDFLVAGEQAFLQVGEIQQGMPAPMNMAWLRLRHTEALAARVALLGDRMAGSTLAQLGLAHEVVADDQVVAAARTLALRLAEHDPDGVRRIKASLRNAGFADSGSAWFDRTLASDPLAGRPMTPRAAENR